MTHSANSNARQYREFGLGSKIKNHGYPFRVAAMNRRVFVFTALDSAPNGDINTLETYKRSHSQTLY